MAWVAFIPTEPGSWQGVVVLMATVLMIPRMPPVPRGLGRLPGTQWSQAP